MRLESAVLPGDGIGPEVVAEGVRVLEAVARRFGHQLVLNYGEIGGGAIDKYGTPLLPATLEQCRRSQAVLLGAMGGPKWDNPQAPVRPEEGLLALRKGLGLFANLRPVRYWPMLVRSPLKTEFLKGVDFIIVRELTGGLYFSRPKRHWTTRQGRRAVDTLAYSEKEIERILRVGFEMALRRRKRLTSVDKANILESSRLWRQIAIELSSEYPQVELRHMLVDSCALALLQRPADFDVLVTENMFGDILSDEVAALAGSLGLMPSASLAGLSAKASFGLYEPVHGSAPDIAGQGVANPIGTILSCALMFRYSFGLEAEAQAIEQSVSHVLESGYRSRDIMEQGKTEVSTQRMGKLIAEGI